MEYRQARRIYVEKAQPFQACAFILDPNKPIPIRNYPPKFYEFQTPKVLSKQAP